MEGHPDIRTGMPPGWLDEPECKRRFSERFTEPAFGVAQDIGRIAAIATRQGNFIDPDAGLVALRQK